MDGEDEGLTLEQAVTLGGEAGTLVMVEGGLALQMPDGVLSAADHIKLENMGTEDLSPEASGTDDLNDGATLVGEAAHEGQLISAMQQGLLGGPELGAGSEINLGEQYVINTEGLEGIVGVDGSILPQAYVPLVMDFDSQDFSGITLAAQIVDGEFGGQKMIILTPGTAIPGLNQVQTMEMIQQDEDEAKDPPIEENTVELAPDETNSFVECAYEQPTEETEDEPATKRIKLEQVDDENGPMMVLTMPEHCEEVTESHEEVVSNVKITLSNESKSPGSKGVGSNVKADTDVTQAWFTTKDDKLALQNKGHQWKQGQWTKEEIDLLDQNIAAYCVTHQIEDPADVIFHFTKEERKDFYRTVAKGLQRPLFSVYRRVIRMYDQKNHIGKYTPEELVRLRELRNKHGSDWATIGAALGRSASSVKDRCRLMRETCNSGKWMPEEERLLAQAVYDLSGCTPGESVTKGLSWAAVADKVGSRSEKQCRTKWLNFLNWKQLGGTDWTRDDDIMLINKLIITEAEDETLVDWNDLSENWPSARSPQWLRGKWWTLKHHVPDYQNTSLTDLLNILKKIHYPKAQMKSSLVQGLNPMGKVDLQHLGMLPNMTLIPVSSVPDGIHVTGGVDALGEEVVSSQGLEIYANYQKVFTTQSQGAYLIAQPPSNGAISMAGGIPTEHIIVHTLPIPQETIIQHQSDVLPEGVTISLTPQPQQVIIPSADAQGGVACLAAPQHLELQLQDIRPTDGGLHDLGHPSDLTETTTDQIEQAHLELESDLSSQAHILPQEDHVHFESQLSESELSNEVGQTGLEHVGIPDVSESQFAQAASNDFIENMSSLSDPMLPSESADLIGSCSDIEGEKSQCATDPAS